MLISHSPQFKTIEQSDKQLQLIPITAEIEKIRQTNTDPVQKHQILEMERAHQSNNTLIFTIKTWIKILYSQNTKMRQSNTIS